MKKIEQLFRKVLTFAIIAFSSTQLFAQHEILVPSNANFYDIIIGDTLEEGGRRDPLAVYVLKRGDVYRVDRTMNINFNLNLIGEDGDDATSMPAVLIPMKNEISQGYPWSYINVVGSNLTTNIKNIIFQGVPSDYEHKVTGTIATVAILETGDNGRLLLDRVVITGFKNAGVNDSSKGGYAKVTNCTFRNIGEPKDQWGGTAFGHWDNLGLLDSLIFQNNTFFNVGCRVITAGDNDLHNYVLIEHNTFFGSTTGFSSPGMENNVNSIVRNNIFVGTHGQGLMKSEEPLWGPKTEDGELLGGPALISIDTVRGVTAVLMRDSLGLTEADRVITLQNNLNWWPTKLVEAWKTLDKDGGAVIEPKYITPRSKQMIAQVSGMTLVGGITDVNPGFDVATEEGLVDIIVDWVWNKRRTTDWTGYYRLFDKEENMFRLEWPLPENLAYTNAALANASTEGLHLGDLNWFPEDKAIWKAGPAALKSNVASDLELSSYPNPFTDVANINYVLTASDNICLTVFDALGKKVHVLVDQFQPAGIYNVSFDASGVAAGIYFVQLESGSFSTTKRVVLTR